MLGQSIVGGIKRKQRGAYRNIQYNAKSARKLTSKLLFREPSMDMDGRDLFGGKLFLRDKEGGNPSVEKILKLTDWIIYLKTYYQCILLKTQREGVNFALFQAAQKMGP